MSGSARIGTFYLEANNVTTRSSVTIDDTYSGTVTTGNNSNFWTNAPVIINGTSSVISMFNNGLGYFGLDIGSLSTPISATHVLNSDGLLILKE